MKTFVLLTTAAAIAPILGCQPPHRSAPIAPPSNAGPAAAAPQPMAAFSRFIGGRWKMTTTAGTDHFDTWSWGPGRQSIRSMRVGTLPNGDPGSVVTVYYWHPTLKQVRLLSVGSVWRGVGEGSAKFEGDSAENEFTLHQVGGPPDRPRGPRDLRERWTFAGPDMYHDVLSERVRRDYVLLAGWDRVRVEAAGPAGGAVVPSAGPESTPSEFMRPLAKVLGNAWASVAAPSTDAPQPADEPRTRTSFEYVPHADAIYGRVEVLGADGASSHAMDVYLYHHTGTRGLRLLALGRGGPDGASVYEGDIVPAADRTSLAIRLTEHRSTAQQAMEARIEFEKDGATRVQVWRLTGQDRKIAMDRRHSRARE